MKLNRRTRVVKMILGVVGFTAFFYTVGVAGSVELDRMGVDEGFIRGLVSVLTFGACVGLNNWIDAELERKRIRILRRQQRQALQANRINGYIRAEY